MALAFDGADGAARVEIDERPFAVRVFDRSGREIAHLLDFAFAPDGAGRVALRAAPGERWFGLGGKTGALDRRGRRFALRNRDHPVGERVDPLYHSIPFLLRLATSEGEAARADGYAARRLRAVALRRRGAASGCASWQPRRPAGST